MLRRAAILGAACLALAGCETETAAVRPAGGLRDLSTPVASQADVTPARMMGRWQVVEARFLPGSLPVSGKEIVIGAAVMRWGEVEAGLTYAGRGRFLWSGEDLWVHWLDADNRTVAVGNPTGQWFAILDRTGQPGERRRAAREVLEWYGYAVRDGAR